MENKAQRSRAKRKRLRNASMLLKLFHLLVTILSFFIAWIFFRYHGFPATIDKSFRYDLFMPIGYGILNFCLLRTYNGYLIGYKRIRTLIFSLILSQIFSIVITYIVVSVSWSHFLNPTVFLYMIAFQFVFDVFWSYIATAIYFKLKPPTRTILIYRNSLDRKRFGSISGKAGKRLFGKMEELKFDGKFDNIKDLLKDYDAIFVAGLNSRCRNGILKYCIENNTPGYFLPHVGDVIMKSSVHIKSFDSPILNVERKELRPEYSAIKRVFDFTVSLIALIVLSPLMLLTALAIRLYDGGPAIYKQVRLTKDAKEFKILKFRSMRVDAEKDGVARLSSGDKDDRITPIGRIVRKCRLDELPQLINILRGDMSIVGPRPERPEIAEKYYEIMPDFKLRLQVKAGLTGYAQVYGKYNSDPYEKLEFDLMYINNMGLLTDLGLMFATFSILFSSESTAGVEVDFCEEMAASINNEKEDDGSDDEFDDEFDDKFDDDMISEN